MKWLAVIAVVASLIGCGQMSFPPFEPYAAVEVGSQIKANLDQSCVADYRPDVDYFPDKLSFSHSPQLSVSYGNNFKRLQFRSNADPAQVMEYLLVQCGTPVPEHESDTVVVEVPVSRIATNNFTILGAIVELGLGDRLVGVSDTRYVTVQEVLERTRKGLVLDIPGDIYDSIEPILASHPDVWLAYFNPANLEYQMNPKITELGVRALPQADGNEPHPLGAAEWLKLPALLGNREAQASAQFQDIVARYEAVTRLAEKAATRPKVMFGYIESRDSFHVVNGRHALAQLIKDVGGRYVLPQQDDTRTGTYLSLPLEEIYAAGARALTWVGGPQGETRVADLVAGHHYYGWFDAVREKQIYTYDLGYAGYYAYPFWDKSLTHPDVLLRETLYAIHPELFSSPPEAQFLRHLQ